MLREALASYESILGERDSQVGQVARLLAMACQAQGRATEAGALYRRAEGILESSLGATHPETAAARRGYLSTLQPSK
jgi:hypothetical protein